MSAKKKATKKTTTKKKATKKKTAKKKTVKKKTTDKETTTKKVAKKATQKKVADTIRIQQVQSPIGRPRIQREALRSLGLRRIRHVVERPDSPAVRGVVAKIPHLVRIVEEE